jgi:hypothetical protein
MKKAALFTLGFLVLATALGFVATNLRSASTEQASGGGGAIGIKAPSADPAMLGAAGAPGSAQGDQVATESVAGAGVSASLPDTPVVGPAVVKTADLTVQVRDGAFDDAFTDATMIASKYGGYVESSSMSGTERRSGSLLIRVPSARFDEAMRDLRGLGVVKGQSVSGQDVTSQFVDLDARLRTWEAQEAVLLDLMSQATTIDQTMRVQRELQDVQYRIEQIKGQLRMLENQTDLATISLSLSEPGAVVVTAQEHEGTPSLAEAWREAVDGFLSVAYATIVGLGYLVPITLLGLFAWLVYRRVARRPVAPGSTA